MPTAKRFAFLSYGLFATLALFLSGCGFHLKGEYDLAHLDMLSVEIMEQHHTAPSLLNSQTANQREALLKTLLQSALTRQGVRVDLNAPYRLQVLSYTLTPYQSALDGEDGAFYEKTMIAEGRYLLFHPDFDAPKPFTSRYQSTVQHRTNAYLSNDDAQLAIEKQLHDESVRQLLQWLKRVTR